MGCVTDAGVVAAAVSAACAAVSLVGGGVAWWRANVSRAAKQEAERIRDEAQRSLEAAEAQAWAAREQAAQVRAIAERLSRPELEVHLVSRGNGSDTWTLVNTTGSPVVVADIANSDAWFRVSIDGETLPVTIDPSGAWRVVLHRGLGRAGAGHLELCLSDGRPLRVPLVDRREQL